MNKIKSRLAMLLAVILLTGSLQGPVLLFRANRGERPRESQRRREQWILTR